MWGALIGAVVTGAISLYSEYQNSQAAAEQKAAAEKAARELKSAYADVISDIEDHYERTPQEQAEADAATGAYREALRNSDQEGMIQDFYASNGLGDGFSYDKEISDFMDPRADYLKAVAGQAAQASAAGSGMGRSYDGAMAIGTAVANKNEDLWKNALSEYNTDRSQAYTEWNSYLATKQKELDQLLTGQANDLSTKKQLSDIYTAEDQSEYEDLLNARLAAMNANYQAAATAANSGNYGVDLGGIIQGIGAGANLGGKVSGYFNGGSDPVTAAAATTAGAQI